jgi:hypothetical protein
MNKRRLLKLADLLEADAKNKKGIQFYYFSWGTVEDPELPMSCGTQACALGLAALSGKFKKAGLSCKIPDKAYETISFRFNGRYCSPINAAMKTFNITPSEASYLFTDGSGLPSDIGARAERAVARRIRDFVAG